jgi:hypothetical protein
MSRFISMAMACVFVLGCGGGGGGGGGGGVPAVFKDFGDGGGKKWEGTWVTGKGDFGGQVWDVKGTDVTVFDPSANKETKYKLKVSTPCSVGLAEGMMTQTYTYVWDGDTLYAGMGSGGFKKGEDAIVCGAGMFNEVFMVKGGKCQSCSEDLLSKGKWTCKDAPDCKLTAEAFEIPSKFGDGKTTLAVKGNLILSDQMAGNKADKVADMAAGKAALKKTE